MFSGLSGKSINLVGTGANNGKCIAGVYIKSGCNQSNDGPNYGEWIANTRNLSDCSTSTPNKSLKIEDKPEDKTKPVKPVNPGTKPVIRGGGK
jgi:hypothetical protein